MVSGALRQLQRERLLRNRDDLVEMEARRTEEVRRAFFEGMQAGNDQWWMGRRPEEYWLESDTRANLYQGPPLPLDPHLRATMRRGHPYHPERDPGLVLAEPKWRKRR